MLNGSLVKIDDSYFGPVEDCVNDLIKTPPPKIEPDYDPKEWCFFREPMHDRTIAQIRCAMNDMDNNLFRRSLRSPNSYFVVMKADELQKIATIFYEIKSSLILKGADPNFAEDVNDLATEFRWVKNEIPAKQWSIGEMLLVGFFTFGIFATLGTWALNRFLLKRIDQALDRTNKNRGDDDDDIGGGGSATGDLPLAVNKPIEAQNSAPAPDNNSMAIPENPAKQIIRNMFQNTHFEDAAMQIYEQIERRHPRTLELEKRLRSIKQALDTGAMITREDWHFFEEFLNGYIGDEGRVYTAEFRMPLISDKERRDWINRYSYEAGPESYDGYLVLSRPENLGSWERSISPNTTIGAVGALILGAHFAIEAVAPFIPKIVETISEGARATAAAH